MKINMIHWLFVTFCTISVCFCALDREIESTLQHILRMNKDQLYDSGLSSFSWSNCGGPNDPIQLKNLTLRPDPIKLPGNVSLAAAAEVGVSVASPVKATVELKKHTWLGWIKVPCVDGVGSCTYNDVCELLDKNFTCPPEFKKYGIPCKCPINKASYHLPLVAVYVQLPPDVPSWLEDGDYAVKASLEQGSEQLGCISIQLSLHT